MARSIRLLNKVDPFRVGATISIILSFFKSFCGEVFLRNYLSILEVFLKDFLC